MIQQKEFLKNINDNRGIIYKIINLYVDDAEDRKDLYQEIVFQSWKSFQNFKEESRFFYLESLMSSYTLPVLLLLGIPLIYLAEKMNKFAFGKYIDKLNAHLKAMESEV